MVSRLSLPVTVARRDVPTTILHLSDLHLGRDIIPRALIRLRPWWKRVDQSVIRGIASAIGQLEPDYVVISGDVVNKPKKTNFREASDCLRQIFLDSGFDLKRKVLIVPGNHDVSFFPRKHSNDRRRLRRYREFLRDFFGETDIDARLHRFYHVDSHGKVIIFCLDSTLKRSAPLAEGELGSVQRNWVKEELRKLSAQVGASYPDYVKIAVVHHHVVPIAGTSVSGERFMQLLDAGDVLRLFREEGFSLVLHGHKHFPHVFPMVHSDSGVLTVIGGGTTTCCFLEEQRGQGNNFNVIKVFPELNKLEVQLFRANENGEFIETNSKTYPLFRIVPLGYSARCLRKSLTIAADGTKTVTIVKEDLKVEQPGKSLNALPIRIISDVAGSKIVDFDFDRELAEVRFQAKTDTAIEGELVLRKPLNNQSAPIDLWYSYVVKDGTAMSQADLKRLYPLGHSTESTGGIVTQHTQRLILEVAFPRQFSTNPSLSIEHLGAEISLPNGRCRMEYDKAVNRFRVEVDQPPLDHKVTVKWTLPPNWP